MRVTSKACQQAHALLGDLRHKFKPLQQVLPGMRSVMYLVADSASVCYGVCMLTLCVSSLAGRRMLKQQ
jgi:hypothetical protein